ncbi:RING finger protein [Aspergillus homomorphus CBS 101889]|uniref:RING-type domain-containing protein n=1 Tax=Aspergillus homomorphus (strain CBS 101889) TaxID=1450537 RepID=A0A395HN75_ASPHC|nr:hypothetical protein BO97DRAFT_427548 [Aspergillus homomorphus CBS 101889]RAL09277.1 hypothetical protein BO97DRAFT_427548 [Aspergillus homomorphus CBS 101889]
MSVRNRDGVLVELPGETVDAQTERSGNPIIADGFQLDLEQLSEDLNHAFSIFMRERKIERVDHRMFEVDDNNVLRFMQSSHLAIKRVLELKDTWPSFEDPYIVQQLENLCLTWAWVRNSLLQVRSKAIMKQVDPPSGQNHPYDWARAKDIIELLSAVTGEVAQKAMEAMIRDTLGATAVETLRVEKKPLPRRKGETECCICFGKLAKGRNITWCKTECGHTFHATCIMKWHDELDLLYKMPECPYCRALWPHIVPNPRIQMDPWER